MCIMAKLLDDSMCGVAAAGEQIQFICLGYMCDLCARLFNWGYTERKGGKEIKDQKLYINILLQLIPIKFLYIYFY